MVDMDTLELVIAIGASLDMNMVKFDIKEAYLSTLVDPEDVYYTRRPPGAKSSEMAYIMQPRCSKILLGPNRSECYRNKKCFTLQKESNQI
jgi:hypothetical protein